MSTLTVDAAWKDLLSKITQRTELRDSDGNLVGTFIPGGRTAGPRIDKAEAERRFKEDSGSGTPLADIWRKLAAEAAE